jgi:hypothetical protein
LEKHILTRVLALAGQSIWGDRPNLPDLKFANLKLQPTLVISLNFKHTMENVANPGLKLSPSYVEEIKAMADRSFSDAPAEQVFQCPFPACNTTYDKSLKLKQHLRRVRGCGFDKEHPKDDPEWDRLDSEGFLTIHFRPAGMSKEEREKRRLESNKRCYERQRANRLQLAKERREVTSSASQIATKFSTYAQSTKTQLENIALKDQEFSAHLHHLYGDFTKFNLEKFVDLTTTDIKTFPYLITYFLPPGALPSIQNVQPGVTKILDAIPTTKHFDKASSRLRTEKIPADEDIEAIFRTAFNLWKPIINAHEMKDEVMFDPNDPNSIAEFSKRGDYHEQAVTMFTAYKDAVTAAMELMCPATLSISGLHTAFWGVKERERMVENAMRLSETEEGEDVESLIEMTMKLRPLVAGRKRKRKSESPDIGEPALDPALKSVANPNVRSTRSGQDRSGT